MIGIRLSADVIMHSVCVCVFMQGRKGESRRARLIGFNVTTMLYMLILADSKNTVRWYCLDTPRFEESLHD